MGQTSRSRSTPASEALTVNVAGLLAEPAGSVRELDVAAPPLDLGPDLRQSRDVEGHVKLTRTNRGLLVQGRFSTALAESCSRCLREFEYPVTFEIDEEALPSIDLVSGQPVDTAEEPDELRLSDHHELELEGEIRDAIALAEPIAPLCREDCPGLCQVCGQELGSGGHDHPETEIDPRLEALRQFTEGGQE
jgi:uncharacterized protein